MNNFIKEFRYVLVLTGLNIGLWFIHWLCCLIGNTFFLVCTMLVLGIGIIVVNIYICKKRKYWYRSWYKNDKDKRIELLLIKYLSIVRPAIWIVSWLVVG